MTPAAPDAAATTRPAERFRGALDPRWSDAAAVLGVLAAVLVLALHLRHLTDRLGTYLAAGFSFGTPTANWIRAAVWLGVVLLVLLGLRPAGSLPWLLLAPLPAFVLVAAVASFNALERVGR